MVARLSCFLALPSPVLRCSAGSSPKAGSHAVGFSDLRRQELKFLPVFYFLEWQQKGLQLGQQKGTCFSGFQPW
jgi:hypothetical protein